MSDKVEVGNTVKLSFVGKLEDGSIFGTSNEPISIEIGTGKLIKGLDKEILGMTQGEEKEVTVSPEEGYGLEDSSLVMMIPLDAFKKSNIEPQIGMMLKTPHGDCRVTEILDKNVEVNYNHPLAGKTLIFGIRIEEIIKE